MSDYHDYSVQRRAMDTGPWWMFAGQREASGPGETTAS